VAGLGWAGLGWAGCSVNHSQHCVGSTSAHKHKHAHMQQPRLPLQSLTRSGCCQAVTEWCVVICAQPFAKFTPRGARDKGATTGLHSPIAPANPACHCQDRAAWHVGCIGRGMWLVSLTAGAGHSTPPAVVLFQVIVCHHNCTHVQFVN